MFRSRYDQQRDGFSSLPLLHVEQIARKFLVISQGFLQEITGERTVSLHITRGLG